MDVRCAFVVAARTGVIDGRMHTLAHVRTQGRAGALTTPPWPAGIIAVLTARRIAQANIIDSVAHLPGACQRGAIERARPARRPASDCTSSSPYSASASLRVAMTELNSYRL